MKIVVGIDATNLRHGGGRTHLIELLRAASPDNNNFSSIIVWGSKSTLALLDDNYWLIKRNPSALDKGLLRRTFWQLFNLSFEARKECCDVLFVPGGSYAGNFRPVVTMCQNILPFEWNELRRYGYSLLSLKFFILRIIQSLSFRRSNGIIFLSNSSMRSVGQIIDLSDLQKVIVPHGLNPRFLSNELSDSNINSLKEGEPIQILYVSTIDLYKHQWHVVEAISLARQKTGLDFRLLLVGSSYGPALNKLNRALMKYDPKGQWSQYLGQVSYDELHNHYATAHIGIWASTCETFGMILVEMMASGLPIFSSEQDPMKELLGESGIYFDPEKPETLANAIIQSFKASEKMQKIAFSAHQKATEYTWERCADQTFDFLRYISK